MIKYYKQLIALFLSAFFFTNVNSTGVLNVDYVDPEYKYKWKGFNGDLVAIEASTPEALIDVWFSSTSRTECSRGPVNYTEPTLFTAVVQFSVNGGGCTNTTISGERVSVGQTCDKLDYPIEEDLNSDGEPDHCHKSQCDRNGEMFENPGLSSPNGYICIAQGNGEFCEHQIGNVQNPDGSVGISIVAPTGESCGTDEAGLPHDPWTPLEDNSLPDPTDPNKPPSDDGNPSCTPIDGTGLNVCSANPDSVCDSSTGVQVCPSGCGTVNDNFVCIVEDGGSTPDIDNPEEQNDNSDNQQDDDPNTSGDEGTHSRLDGLLENTDGIEGLLQGIKDAIKDNNTGADSNNDEGEEEPNCPSGQFYIGENCVTFDKNDQPVNGDLDFSEIDQKIAQAETDLETQYNNIKSDLDNLFGLTLTGGSYTPRTETIKGVQIDFSLSRLSNLFNFSIWGAVVMFVCGIRAVLILVGG